MKILRKIFLSLKTFCNLSSILDSRKKDIVSQKIMLGKILSNQIKDMSNVTHIQRVEFKVFSQFGDDGIIQYLINQLNIDHKIFIEFGVEDYQESNTRFLLMNNNWSGLVMDNNKQHIESIKHGKMFWKYDLTAIEAFITRSNINEIISSQEINGEIGLLSIDIDGNDYWVWKEINIVTPVIVIVEYNSVFGIERPITIPYSPDFNRSEHHYSNLYWGTSLLSLCDLAELKGYVFIGCNSNGNNAYFVRKDKINFLSPLKVIKPEKGYVLSKYRESRNEDGSLSYMVGDARLDSIKGMPVINTRTNKLEIV